MASWGKSAMPLYIVEKMLDDLVLLDLRGRLILGRETADLRGRLGRLLDSGHLRIILKLEGVSYIDSSGLSTLVACYTSARKRGGDLKLTHLTTRVRDLMQITRLSTVFETYNTVEEAQKSFQASS
ncbi:MAG: anti-sigma factor antagonist [Acidobacteria bacterium]|nr:MAG: anti-sigma factor antagonist [Acidobacteriota bacterium]PYV24682.1 MAG: anti-sigma factor antagonist [Acidobacteriota bacterium]